MSNQQESSRGRVEAQGSLDELRAMLRQFDTAMLVTLTTDGMLRARPMAIQDPDEMPDCDLWFVTAEPTAKTGEVAREQQVAVCCYRPRDQAYISISARAAVDPDREKVRQLWKPSWTAWIPEGPDHPQAALLKLWIERAEYWEPQGGKLRVLYEAAKAILKGEPAANHLNPPKHV